MTLRTKLALFVGLAVAQSIALTLFLTWQRVGQFILSSEEAHFANMAETVENNLLSSYREYLAFKVRLVISAKRQLYAVAMDARNDQRVLEEVLSASEDRKHLGKSLLHNHKNESAIMSTEKISILLTTAGELQKEGFPALEVGPETRSVKQQSFADILINLSTGGEFALWPTRAGDNRVLLFFLPVDQKGYGDVTVMQDTDRVLVSGIRLNKLFHEAEDILQTRISATKQNFERIHFYENGLLLLRDMEGNVLVKRGDDTAVKDHLQSLYAQAHQFDHARGSVQTEAGEYLCHVAWIEAFRWYFVMAAPLYVLREPSNRLVSQLLVAGLAILLAATLFTIVMVMRTMHPLARLRDCTSELATMDPSSSASLDAMESMLQQRLNLQRHDELGDLARSFARMGRQLTQNIRSSMAAITEQKRIEGELSAAKDIQMGILPVLDGITVESGFAVAAFLEPAREVGGDLYDCFTLADGKKVLVMGDVSGKGVPAALFMTMTVTLVRSTLRSGLDPAQALTQINALLEEHNPGSMFVTLFLAIYSPESGELLYANGGHCPPYIIDTAGHVRQLEKLSGPLVGAMPDLEYLAFKDTLAPGECCFLYTDGLTEAMNAQKELYGEDRLAECLAAHAQASPSALHKAVFADICAFRGEEPPSDDITMLAMRRHVMADRNTA